MLTQSKSFYGQSHGFCNKCGSNAVLIVSNIARCGNCLRPYYPKQVEEMEKESQEFVDPPDLEELIEILSGEGTQSKELLEGELIELLRNKEKLCISDRKIPLPPQGRLCYPKQTAASSEYGVGEQSE